MSLVSRRMLLGVPRLHFYEGGSECPRDLCLPAAMTSVVQFLDDPILRCHCSQSTTPACKVTCSYSFFVGVSGIASHFAWKSGWADDNLDVRFMSEDLFEPFARVIHAAGLDFDVVGPSHGNSESACRASICSSIDRGMPVIAVGPILGPPEPLLITGYDDDGDVIIGWSFFQNLPPFRGGLHYTSTGEFRKSDWFSPSEQIYLILRNAPERSPLSHLYRDGLQWMLRIGTAHSASENRARGLDAYDAWAEELLRDERFPADQKAHRHEVHNNAVGFIAEARWYGSKFLVQAAEPPLTGNRASEQLLAAASSFAAQHRLMWDLWDLSGGHGSPDGPNRFADPAIRRRMVPVIQEARIHHAEALEQIERAIDVLRVR